MGECPETILTRLNYISKSTKIITKSINKTKGLKPLITSSIIKSTEERHTIRHTIFRKSKL